MERTSKSSESERPVFPKRALITAGMPYGNKELHMGHIGGLFVHADTFARFLRDRIGQENILFVSGTDCYGSPAFEAHRQLTSEGGFDGTVEDFVEMNHKKQKEALDAFNIDLSLFSASALGRAGVLHREFTAAFIKRLYDNGHLNKRSTLQFYDEEKNTFLNGRQVVGVCPICSDKGYADECGNGHQYEPVMLLDPVSTLSGKRPAMREVTNWYIDLGSFGSLWIVGWLSSGHIHLPGPLPSALLTSF